MTVDEAKDRVFKFACGVRGVGQLMQNDETSAGEAELFKAIEIVTGKTIPEDHDTLMAETEKLNELDKALQQ